MIQKHTDRVYQALIYSCLYVYTDNWKSQIQYGWLQSHSKPFTIIMHTTPSIAKHLRTRHQFISGVQIVINEHEAPHITRKSLHTRQSAAIENHNLSNSYPIRPVNGRYLLDKWSIITRSGDPRDWLICQMRMSSMFLL
jgi:hypothetical protein